MRLGHEHAEGHVLDRESRDLGAEQHHGDIDRPQLDVAGHGDRDRAQPEREHQRSPGEAREGDIFGNRLGDDRRHVAQHPAALEHDRADGEMPDRGLGQHEAGIVGEDGGAAEHDDEPEACPGHEAEFAALDARVNHLRDGAGDRDACRQHDVVGREIDDQKDDGREEIGGEPCEHVFHRLFLF